MKRITVYMLKSAFVILFELALLVLSIFFFNWLMETQHWCWGIAGMLAVLYFLTAIVLLILDAKTTWIKYKVIKSLSVKERCNVNNKKEHI